MHTEEFTDFSFALPFMEPGETVLWRGKPEKGNLVTSDDIITIPFSILWCGFACFWEYSVLKTGFKPFILFGLVFVCIGLYFVFGRFIHTAWKRKHTSYVITNQKIICKRGNQIDLMNAKNMPPVQVKAFRNGCGTITIGMPVQSYGRRSMNEATARPFVLENVPNVALVNQMINRMDR